MGQRQRNLISSFFMQSLKSPREMKNGYYFVPNSVLIEIESFFCALISVPFIPSLTFRNIKKDLFFARRHNKR